MVVVGGSIPLAPTILVFRVKHYRKRKNRVNEQIRVSHVKFIDENGTLIGEKYPTDKALSHCKAVGLDLVEVVPNTSPPVCKALDFGKFRFQASKKKQVVKKQQLKEIKLRPGIGDEDYEKS